MSDDTTYTTLPSLPPSTGLVSKVDVLHRRDRRKGRVVVALVSVLMIVVGVGGWEVWSQQNTISALTAKSSEQTTAEVQLRGDVTTLLRHDNFDNLIGELLYASDHHQTAEVQKIEAQLNNLHLVTHLALPAQN
jgi:hypothetical protein